MVTLTWTRMEANRVLRELGLADAGWTFDFDNAKVRAGQTNYRLKRITVSRIHAQMNDEKEVVDTILHEAAHALAGYGAGHGPVWKRMARQIGCTGQRTHNADTPTPPYAAVCPVHGTIGHRHRRLKGAIHNRCGNAIEWVDTRITAG